VRCKNQLFPLGARRGSTLGQGEQGWPFSCPCWSQQWGLLSPALLPACAMAAGAANPLRGDRRAGWLIPGWSESSGGGVWDGCCHQSLLCLPWHLPAHASLQFTGQNPHQIPLGQRSFVLSLGPGQAGGSPGRMTKCSPSIWPVVPMPAFQCRRSASGRNVHSC